MFWHHPIRTVRILLLGLLALAVLVGGGAPPAVASAGTTERVSVASDGSPGNADSNGPAISADGRYVAFWSVASNLVPADTNDEDDIFVHDRQTGTTERVSVASDGSQGNDQSWEQSISADGRYVAFMSGATNLVAGDTNGTWDVFVHDRQSGTTERVSVASDGSQANGSSSGPAISGDGRFVAFGSNATNLVPGDTNNRNDIFVHDRLTGTTERVSVASAGSQANGSSSGPAISGDGRYVAFSSWASDLVPGDTNNSRDIFVHDRQMVQTSRVSIASDGSQGNLRSTNPSISADGRYVAFVSYASNLVPGDSDGIDVFVHDRQTGTTERVNVASDGSQANMSAAGWMAMSGDGRYVAFTSSASNLVPGDTNGWLDTFVHDRQTGTTERVSVASDGSQGNWDSQNVAINADGRYVAFGSWASNLLPGGTNAPNVFVRDRCPDGSCGGEPSHRKVVFVQGLSSQSDCGDGFVDRVSEMRNYLLNTTWVQAYAPLQANDFVYFTYELDPATDYCDDDPAQPNYSLLDSCRSLDGSYGTEPVAGAAEMLDDLITGLVAADPAVEINILGHSQGGVLAAYWLADVAAPAVRDNVKSIVTFDSPVGGMDLLRVGWKAADCAGYEGATVSTSPYDAPYDLWEDGAVINGLQDAPAHAKLFTLRDKCNSPCIIDPGPTDVSATFKRVTDAGCEDTPGDEEASRCAGVIDLYDELGGHSGAWDDIDEYPFARKLLGCAVTGAVWRCVPDLVEYLALEQGQTEQTTAAIPSNQQAASFCVCGVGSQADLTLIDPNGQTVLAGDPGVTHRKGEGYDIWEVDNPIAGTWTLSVYGADIPPGGETVTVQVGTEPVPPPDADSDGVEDSLDNCVNTSNWSQVDTDLDGAGDACDSDDDGDEVDDASDNCPLVANGGQEDVDADGLGDTCDGDNDNDGMQDVMEDGYPCLDSTVDDGSLDPDGDTLANLVETLVGTDPCVPDSDGDDFDDGVELFLGTDPLAPCPTVVGAHAAWPPDFNDDTRVNLADVFLFRSHFATIEEDPDYDRRFDLNADGRINLADVFILRQYFATECI